MDANECFEIEAEGFRKTTGYLAPGKDVPATIHTESYENERQLAWKKWMKDKRLRTGYGGKFE